MLTITETYLDSNGVPVINTAIQISPDISFIQDLGGGIFVTVAAQPIGQATDGTGTASFVLPWPSNCFPVPNFILRDVFGAQVSGRVPEGVNGPLSIPDLLALGWRKL